jgi:lipopolysaccharide/colanic/teichoic acid biosynthesis glycosyltransferase
MSKVRISSVADNTGQHRLTTESLVEKTKFKELIRRERERSDRSRKEFSLTVFDLHCLTDTDVQIYYNRIRQSMRSIDEIGWWDERSIGVILPSTSHAGSAIFAVRASEGKIPYKIYTYPDNWLPDYKVKEDKEDNDRSSSNNRFPPVFKLMVPPWKRALDIIGSLLGLAVLWPVFVLISIYIKIVSPGPAFFTQQRIGREGKLFTFIKFRTMKYNNDQTAHRDFIVNRIRSGNSLAKLDDHDKRIILGGRIIRKTCLDELPQLFNVLLGEMSLVGPRPCLPYEAQEFLLWHTHRFDALPGMTGLWQVSGKNKLTFTQMIRLDISYCAQMSFINDIKIILRTFPAIVVMVFESIAKRVQKDLPMTDDTIREKAIV